MKGVIIGDVIGSSYKFKNTNIYGFQLLTENTHYMDGTLYVLSFADAFMSNKDYLSSVKKWCDKNPEFNGNKILPYFSFILLSNMCLSASIHEALKLTKCFSLNTKTFKSVETFVELCHTLKNTKKKDSVIQLMNKNFGYNWLRQLPKKGEYDDTCQGILPLAVSLFNKSTGFDDALRLAVSYGWNTDVLSSMVGTLAEIYYGVPDNLWERVKEYLPHDFLYVVDKFYKSIS